MAKTTNPFKKEFAFEKKLYKAITSFIVEDTKTLGHNNFDIEYVEAMLSYRKLFNKKFCGMRFRMPLIESAPGSEKWIVSADSDVNFGNIWESVANKYIKPIREVYGYKPWPNKITQFPDFREEKFMGDFKSCLTTIYADTKANQTAGKPIGTLLPGGVADLYPVEDYKKDIEIYRETGVLSEHLKALLVFAIYEYKYDEHTGEKYAIIYDVIVCPALFCINFRTNGALAIRSGKVTIGFQERNIDFISQKNFGV